MITIRIATLEDAADLLEWRNDPHSRAMFRNDEQLESSTHMSWLKKTLHSPNSLLYIGEFLDSKVGVCRFDYSISTGHSEVSLNLNPEFRGRGHSAAFLQTCIDTYRRAHSAPLTATIKVSNIASKKIFEKCGFVFKHESDGFVYYELGV